MINKLHERSLKITLNDCYSSDFNILLENNNDICNHHINIQYLLNEVFKMKNRLPPPIMESILNKRFNTYNLRNIRGFATEIKRTVWYGLEILSYRYPQLWFLLPENHTDCEKFMFKCWIFIMSNYMTLSNLVTWQPLTKKNFSFNFF